MKARILKGLILICALMLACGCSKKSWKVEEIASPAGPDSGMPYLSAIGDEVWMSWIEQDGERPTVKCAVWNGQWGHPHTIISGSELLMNWADFPSILPLSNGSLAAHWLQKRGNDKYAYDVISAISKDHGDTWSHPLRVHRDETENEHGFASLVELENGDYSVTWLDARNYKTAGAMSLMHAVFQNGTFQSETSLDPRVCDCCQTGVARIPGGLIVVYRDRSEAEIRDISYVRLIDGKWSSPKVIHADQWKIDGCPVNGPAVASNGKRIAVAWYTGAHDQPRVYAVFSKDSGASFSAPVRVDSGNPSGRVDIEMLEDGSAVVSWMENQKDKGADIRVRQLFSDGRTATPIVVADTARARSSGVPRMARSGKNILIAWTFTSDPSRIRVTKVSMQ